jgi:2'-5' RNA ligase
MRLFVACLLPEEIRERLSLVQEAAGQVSGLKWVERSNLHVTLKFLGEVREASAGKVERALGFAGAPRAFTLAIRGTGAFPNTRVPRVVWAGICGGQDELASLARSAEAALLPYGFEREKRPFSPHITLARAREGQIASGLSEALAGPADRDFGRFIVEEYCLMRSELLPAGPMYTVLRRYALSG